MVLVLTATMLFSTLSSGAKADSRILNIMGNNRTETSARAAKLSDDSSIEDYGKIRGNYVFANSKYFADALSAYNLVFDKNARLILIDNSTDIDKYINGANNAYIVGGTGAISSQMENKIRSRFKMVKRYGGSNRYITNSLILDDCNFTKLGIADGRNYPDALAASGLLKKENLGLMLVDGSKTYATSRDVKYIFGGINSVRQIGGNRLAGGNRYDTCTAINMKIDNAKNIAFVSGKNFADALSSLNIINYAEDTSIVLTEGDLGTYVNDKSLNLFAVGGELKSKIQNRVPNDGRNNPIAQSNSKEIWMRDYTRTRKKFKISNWNDVSSLHINIISGNEVMIVTYKDGKKVTIDSSPGRFVDVLQESYELPLERVDEFSDFVGDVYDLARIIKGDYQ